MGSKETFRFDFANDMEREQNLPSGNRPPKRPCTLYAVTEIVKELINTGFVKEVGTGESKGGRKPIELEFQHANRCVLGVDIGATHISVALTDLRGALLEWREVKHNVRNDPVGSLQFVMQLCDECLATRNNGKDDLLGIGVSLPSPIDPVHPGWISEVVLPAWHGSNEIEQLHKKYGAFLYTLITMQTWEPLPNTEWEAAAALMI